MRELRVMTIVGTRPEIIRLSRLVPELDGICHHRLVHTGQNSDPKLNDVFFKDLRIRQPDAFLGVDNSSFGSAMAGTISRIEAELREFSPDAVMILGDTNSAISAVVAERMQIPVYHMEAGNRSHDSNVPEELNRKMVDHVSTFNLAYNEHSRRNLLAEGINPRFLSVTGSPMREVLDFYEPDISSSAILDDMKLQQNEFFLASFHRQENVDVSPRLGSLVKSLVRLSNDHDIPVVISTHPRTRRRLEETGLVEVSSNLIFAEPFGFFDYVKLQTSAKCVLSDSGTVSEESAILKFPAVSIRDSIERQEAIEVGSMILTGLDETGIGMGVERALRWKGHPTMVPEGYESRDFSRRVVNFVLSTVHNWKDWKSLRALG